MWIELHDNLPDHPKIVKLAALTKMDRDLARAKLERLWLWALTNRLSGALSYDDVLLLTDVMRIKGDPQKMVDALVACGLLEDTGDGYYIHDWDEHAGALIERKEEQRAYNKRKNALYNDLRLTKAVRDRDGDTCQYCGKTVNWRDRKGCDGGTYDHIDPDGDNSLDNLCVACRSCNSSKRGRTPWAARMRFVDNSALWQIYGRFYGRYPADKSSIKSAITVPIPNKDSIDDPTTLAVCARETAPLPVDNFEDQVRETISDGFLRLTGREANPVELDALVANTGADGGMSPEMVLLAVSRAVTYGAKSIVGYSTRVMGGWRMKGLFSPAAVDEWEAARDGV